MTLTAIISTRSILHHAKISIIFQALRHVVSIYNVFRSHKLLYCDSGSKFPRGWLPLVPLCKSSINYNQLCASQVIEHYTKYKLDERYYIFSVLPPLTLLSLIPNLKALAPFSAAANTFMATGLGITLYKLIFETSYKSMWELRQTPFSLESLPSTFSITVFAMEAIGLVGMFSL